MASSREGVSLLVALRGGSQKDDQLGSKRPAPGTTMSTVGKADSAADQREVSWGQEVTSVLWKSAEGLPGVLGYLSRRDWASGRQLRSAMMTEQPLLRSRRENVRLMPVCVCKSDGCM